MFFAYGEAELACLRARDKRLCEVIDKIGHVDRVVDTDLFSAVVHHIIGQQISTKAQATIWQRMQDALGTVNAETILAAGVPKLQALGMTFRKAEYITDFAERVHSGAFDPEGIRQKSDEDAIRELSALKGIGVWTAEMILLFCMQRPNIFSYDDLAIQRGLRMVYHHRKIDRKLFEKYRRRFSPYCSVASLYLLRSASRRFSASFSVSSFLAKWKRIRWLTGSRKKLEPGTAPTPTLAANSSQNFKSLS